MIDIKDIDGKVILSVPITQGSERVIELMKYDYVQLTWSSDNNETISVGSYIEYNGEVFSLLDPYKPEQKDEFEYEYKPQFQSKVMLFGKIPFFLYTETEKGEHKEIDWSLTDNPSNFMSYVCKAIKTETGEDWTFAVESSLKPSMSLSFSSLDVFSALNSIANAFETEWWADKVNNVLHLGKCQHGESITLEVGVNIKVPSVTKNNDGYYTRFYAFGSTRNIEQDYQGANANNVVNKRLTLDPNKYPNGYKDIKEGLKNGEIFSKVLIFDDIYPSSKLKIDNVRVRLLYRLDAENNKIQIGTNPFGAPIYEQYAIWYFRIPDYKFDIGNVISGLTPSVSFKTGALAGREFEITCHLVDKLITSTDGEPFQVKAGDYEIHFIEENSNIIPSITGITPIDGDEIVLFNIKMPEEYVQSAYDELETALNKNIEKYSNDYNSYQLQSNPVAFYYDNSRFELGQNVTYINGDYSFETRVIKLVKKLDCEYEQTITIGNESIKGNTEQLKEDVVNANTNIKLLSSLNTMTNALTQAYQRTQKIMMDGFASIKDMWYFDEEDPSIIKTKYSVCSYGSVSAKGVSKGTGASSSLIKQVYGYSDINKVFSNSNLNDTFNAYTIARLSARITALEQNGGGGGGGGVADSIEWEKVLYKPSWLVDKKPSVSFFENDAQYITSDALNPYATQQWVNDKGYAIATDVANTYVTKTTFNTLKTDFDNLSALLNDDVQGKINTWHEVVDFLDEYSGSQDLAAILSGMNTDIASRVEKSKFAEYFNSEMANWFIKDDTNKGVKPANGFGFYSESYISAKGVSTGTGGSGGSSYDRLDRWSDYTSDKAGWILSALLGQDLNSRLASLESGSALSLTTLGSGNAVTSVSKSGNQLVVTKGATFLTEHQSLSGYQPLITNSNKLAYSLISGTPTSLPASDVAAWAKAASKPSYAFSEITNKPTTLGGYGITDAYTATTIDGKLSGYLPLSGGRMTGTIVVDEYTSFGQTGGWFYLGNPLYPLKIRSAGTTTINDNTIIHSGNYSSYALPLSGGTITGTTTTPVTITTYTVYSAICFKSANGYRTFGIKADGELFVTNLNGWSAEHTLIHSGNIGSQSVNYATSAGSANKLDGYNLITEVTDWNSAPNTILKSSESNTANAPYGGFCYGAVLRFHRSPSVFYTDLVTNLYSDLLFYRRHSDQGYGDWKQIAFTDSNVASATKLQKPRTIWGQSFDGTGDVSGNIVTTGSITGSYFSAQHALNPYVQLIEGSNSYYLQAYEGVLYFGSTLVKSLSIDREGNVSVVGNIVATGSVTAKSSSDYRLKCAFDYNVDYQERLLSLGKVCDFNYTPHAQEREFAFADDKRHTSVIWQDARKANITGFCSVEEDGYGTINPLSSDLIFTMVGAIQQGIVKTERIEERVVRLEKENRELKEKINLLEGGRYGC